jgi:hypothetical protein
MSATLARSSAEGIFLFELIASGIYRKSTPQAPHDSHSILLRSTAMRVSKRFHLRSLSQFASSFAAVALVLASVVLTCSQPANALPAFARKYGLRCSACHESWPMLNYFGQKFKDNGYQIMNDRDSPDLAESQLLAGHLAHYAHLAPR